MLLSFIHRNPTAKEIEKLRLILSTYQDGTGMLVDKVQPGKTLPGWRDFERSIASTFEGHAQESKSIFDVLLNDPDQPDRTYGLSCKMRSELNRIDRDGRVTLEISNSSGQFWSHLYTKGITQNNYRDHPLEVGAGLFEVVESWYKGVNIARKAPIDINNSYYLVLSWNTSGWYQIHQFALNFPSAYDLNWYCPVKQTKAGSEISRRINGSDEQGTLFEWYGESGGQLKYYPPAANAIWSSERFRLEPLGDIKHGIIAKVSAYFPEQWENVNTSD